MEQVRYRDIPLLLQLRPLKLCHVAYYTIIAVCFAIRYTVLVYGYEWCRKIEVDYAFYNLVGIIDSVLVVKVKQNSAHA